MPVTALSHNSLTGTELHEAKRTKQPVRAASTGNLALSGPGGSIDGVAMVAGDRVLLKDQTTATQNGIYVWAAAASALVRASDAAVNTDFGFGFQVYVREGVVNAGSVWLFTQPAAFTINTTAVTFAKLNATGYVTSVALTVPAEFTVAGSPINGGSGTIAVTKANQSANRVYAGPSSGAAAPPAFRAIVPADVPVMGASGASHAAGLVPDPGATVGTSKYLREDGTFSIPAAGAGSVTSVGLTAPSEFTVTGSPVTGSGTIAITKANQTANQVYAGPTSGAAAAPAFRALASADLPAAPTVSGEVTASDFKPAGLTGATAATRYGGGTATGAPTSGTWAVGDWIVDQTGKLWVCTTAGTPGTWTQIAGGGGGGSAGPAGANGALVPIQVIGPLTAAQASLSFSNIPQTGYRNLRIKGLARGTTAATQTSLLVQANGDSAANYDSASYQSNSTTTLAESIAGTTGIIGAVVAANAPAAIPSGFDVSIDNYTSTTFDKVWRGVAHLELAASTTNIRNVLASGTWKSTSAVTSLSLSLGAGNFDIGSYACLYGETDTAGSLLTPASNLLYDSGQLTATQASVSSGALPQAYRDLVVEVIHRGTNAAAQVLNLQFNGDTGANYDVYGAGAAAGLTSLRVGVTPPTGQTANQFASSRVTVTSYTQAQMKEIISLCSRVDTSAIETNAGTWRSTAAITSVTVSPAAGLFDIGTTVRIYGEPASAGGASVGTGTRLRNSANQSIATATATAIAWDTEDNDADNQHYTSSAALTGTVAKTAGSNALVGTSTLFTTELSVGQIISVPGTAAEVAVVTAITDATHLTVAGAGFANTATGQTATRVNTAVVFRQPGFYTLETTIYSAALASGNVTIQYRLNGSTIIDQKDQAGINASAGYELVTQRQFQQWDYVETLWTQNSGGAVNVLADERTHWSVGARPTVIVAIPYVHIIDQKTAPSDGGSSVAGSWQTRTLNTKDSDAAGIATLASNQFTLPPGTYRIAASAPAYESNSHAVRLQNITDTATTLRGTNEFSATTASIAQTRSQLSGRFTISGQKTFEIQHYCNAARATYGLGLGSTSGLALDGSADVYTVVEIWKEG